MKVRELIEQLQQFDPEMVVVAAADPEKNRDHPVIRCEISPWEYGGESGTDVFLSVGYSREDCFPPILNVEDFGIL